jgi:hypothetical protein
MQNEASEVVGDDLLWGTPAIAKELRKTPRQVVHMLQNHLLPVGKVGGRVVASKKRLREYFAAATAGEGV